MKKVEVIVIIDSQGNFIVKKTQQHPLSLAFLSDMIFVLDEDYAEKVYLLLQFWLRAKNADRILQKSRSILQRQNFSPLLEGWDGFVKLLKNRFFGELKEGKIESIFMLGIQILLAKRDNSMGNARLN